VFYGKNEFAKISKNLARYRFEILLDHQKNCIESSRLIQKDAIAAKSFQYFNN